AIVHAELKRGLSSLATIGSTAPFVGLLGTVIGILTAFKKINETKAAGLASVAGGISEALVTTAVGLFVAIPAVMMFNYCTCKRAATSRWRRRKILSPWKTRTKKTRCSSQYSATAQSSLIPPR